MMDRLSTMFLVPAPAPAPARAPARRPWAEVRETAEMGRRTSHRVGLLFLEDDEEQPTNGRGGYDTPFSQ